jgi:hypothetical protein
MNILVACNKNKETFFFFFSYSGKGAKEGFFLKKINIFISAILFFY